jgi:tol-pal system protein YbgF
MAKLAWGIAGAALLLPGCFYPRDRALALEARVEQLQARSDTMTAQVEESRQKVADLILQVDAKLAEVTKALEQLDSSSRRSDADIGVRMGKLLEDVATLTGQLDQYRFQLSQLDEQLRKLGTDSEGRLTALEGGDAQKAAEARRRAEQLKALERPTDKKEFLALADEKAKAGELEVARKLYGEFLQKWPKDALVADALLHLGQSYVSEDRCREALYEYQKVIQDHAKSAAAAPALLGSADCFAKLKMKAEARLALEELVKGYPKSAAAKEARARLAEMDKAAKPSAPAKAKPAAGRKGAK